MPIIAFDLDGSLSDPAVGITASINYALEQLGIPRQAPDSLTKYIGPPLDTIFSDLLNMDNSGLIDQAIAYYRDRYSSVGFTENILYEGVTDVLNALIRLGMKLYVATSKRTDIATSVIEYLKLQSYFVQVLGCGRSRQKSELLQEIRTQESESTLFMIGDRSHDMVAGQKAAATCVGVLWGYGNVTELEEAGADVLIQTPPEIVSYVLAKAAA